MARERSIVVRLKAEVSDYQSKMSQASRSLSDFEREQQKLGGAATTTMGRMVQSAKINEREWTQVGTALLGVGTATAAIGAASLKTGVDYNAMRQKATQALTAVTGSTETAAAQMRRLDEFGRGSWLMRDTLIRAQTQMTGFGIETGKVIPYMSALADAVAATGGSNQDFEELARLMGQVQSQGKITARELMQFGIRGIDAAQLIGDAMGKTAGQIRDDITSGALDAGTALDALAKGMAENFDGASDLVRETFGGAMDNLKAAWRDLMASFATPLVDPEGGGLLVGWVNNIADSLFGLQGIVEAMPSWMKTGALAIGGFGTAASITAGTLMVALPKYVQLRESISTLAATHPQMAKFSNGLLTFGTHAAGAAGKIGATVAAVGALASLIKSNATARGLNEVQREIRALAEAGDAAAKMDLTAVFRELPSFLGKSTMEARDFNDVFEKILNPSLTDRFGESLASVGNIVTSIFGRELPSYMADYREAAEELDAALTSLLNAGGSDTSAAVAFIESLGLSTEELAEVLPGARDAMVLLEDASGSAGTAMGDLAGETDEAAKALEDWMKMVHDSDSAFISLIGAYNDVIEKNKETAQATADATKSSKDSWQDYYDGVSFSMKDYLKALEDQVKAQQNWEQNMLLLSGRVSKGVLDHLAELGPEGAPLVSAFVDASDAELARLEAVYGHRSAEATSQFAENLMDAGPVLSEIMATAGDKAAKAAADSLAKGEKTLQQVASEYDVSFTLNADTAKAISDANAMMGDWNETTTDTKLSANTDPGKDRANALMSDWRNTETETFLSANPDPAVRIFNDQTNAWEDTTTDTLLDLNPNDAVSVFNRQTGSWQTTTTKTLLGMNPSEANRLYGITTSSWRNQTTNTNLGLNTGGAKSSFWDFKWWLGRQTLSKSISTPIAKGSYSGGWLQKGLMAGGATLPGKQAGGWVPGQRAGYDNVMWPLYRGGQVLGQPLEGREFVVRSSQANRPDYAPILEAINRGEYQADAGGRSGPVFHIHNYYPQAEPTSVTVNRGLQYAAAMGE